MIIKKPLYPKSVTVWCGCWAGGIIGPHFIENEAAAAVSVNGMRYRTIINEFSWPELEDMDVDNVNFQQDDATCHNTSGETIGLLREKFPGRVISRNGNYNWPLRSCDLIPLVFFLWGYVKEKVYADAPQSIQEFREKIGAVIDEIDPQMCEDVKENFMHRPANVAVETISMILFCIMNGKPSAIE